ncbi:MAG: BrnT family toxin [bacterium]
MYGKRVYEFDERKSRLNRVKHGIDFYEAQKIWDNSHVAFLAKGLDEIRYAIIGQVREHTYTCIYTMRGQRIRLISCRRSRKQERQLYEEAITQT